LLPRRSGEVGRRSHRGGPHRGRAGGGAREIGGSDAGGQRRAAILVWLDDLQRFFTGTGPLTPALLTRLTTRPGPTIVLATLRQDQRDRLRDSSGELSRDTRTLLDDAAPFTIELRPTTEDPHEQAAARAAYPGQDLTGIGLAEELAHAPALLRAYYDSTADDDPTKHAVTRVAIDWERVGIERPIPEPDLVRLTRKILWTERPDLERDDEQLAKAIEDARKPLPGPGQDLAGPPYSSPTLSLGISAAIFLSTT
jgi:hypothetical protein